MTIVIALAGVLTFVALLMSTVQIGYMMNRKRRLEAMVRLAKSARRVAGASARRAAPKAASVHVEFPSVKIVVKPRKNHATTPPGMRPVQMLLRTALGADAARQGKTTLHIERNADATGTAWHRYGDGPSYGWLFSEEALTDMPTFAADLFEAPAGSDRPAIVGM